MLQIKKKANALKTKLTILLLAIRHERTPWYAKLFASITICYALSPIDLIPDFIPVLGYLDDIILLPFFIFITLHLIPEDAIAECELKSDEIWKDGKPKKWYYAIPILIIWGICIGLILYAVIY